MTHTLLSLHGVGLFGENFLNRGGDGSFAQVFGREEKSVHQMYVYNRICLMSEFWLWVVLEFCEVSCAQNSCSPSGSWSPLPLGEHYASWALPFSKAAERPLPEFLHGMLHSFQLLLPLSVYGPWVLISPTPNRQPIVCQHPKHKLILHPVTLPLYFVNA